MLNCACCYLHSLSLIPKQWWKTTTALMVDICTDIVVILVLLYWSRLLGDDKLCVTWLILAYHTCYLHIGTNWLIVGLSLDECTYIVHIIFLTSLGIGH